MLLQLLGLFVIFLIAVWFCGAAWVCLFVAPMFADRKWQETIGGFILATTGVGLMWYVFSHFSVSLS